MSGRKLQKRARQRVLPEVSAELGVDPHGQFALHLSAWLFPRRERVGG